MSQDTENSTGDEKTNTGKTSYGKIGLAGLLFGVAGLSVFFWPAEEVVVEEAIIEQSVYIPPPPSDTTVSPVKFTEVTHESGITYQHFSGASLDSEGNPTRFMPETMGPGVALLDFDLDGDLDIFIANSSNFDDVIDREKMSPKLYRNNGEMRFSDITKDVGLDVIGYGMGAAVADYDGDQYPDLLLTGWGQLALLRNVGGKAFDDVSEKVLPSRGDASIPDWSTSALFFDAEGDGDLDIYIANYVQWSPETDLFSTIDGHGKSYATPTLYRGGSSRLYLQSDGKFEDKTAEAGMLNDEGKSLGSALWDFNEDGLLDIIVANDTQPNFLYYNLGGGKFENRALEAGIAYDANGKTRAGMGVDVADIGNDGHVCIAIGNFSREPVSVFRNEGGDFFRETSQQAGVAEDTYMPLTFGLNFVDFDLDGWQDLIMANGHIEPEIENVESEITYKQPLVLLGNTGSAHFENWSDTAGDVFKEDFVGRGLAVGDLDNDGDIDIVATENSGAIHLLRNDSNSDNQYLRVELKGKAPNTNAIGAKIQLVSSDGTTQQRMIKGGSSYLSQSELVQTFGLGEANNIDVLRVTWPSGNSVDYSPKEINQTIVIEEVSNRVVSR